MTAVQLKTLLSLVNNRLRVEGASIRKALCEDPSLWLECHQMWHGIEREILQDSAPLYQHICPMCREVLIPLDYGYCHNCEREDP